jgi:hypothetical protein
MRGSGRQEIVRAMKPAPWPSGDCCPPAPARVEVSQAPSRSAAFVKVYAAWEDRFARTMHCRGNVPPLPPLAEETRDFSASLEKAKLLKGRLDLVHKLKV